ncbi:MAG TPA: hypothetical protein HPP77_10255 [Candidatus Hydrogenedentes bacterium]|nr:hypothetical protein [Candidatus Hydrogenedentota bacterium]
MVSWPKQDATVDNATARAEGAGLVGVTRRPIPARDAARRAKTTRPQGRCMRLGDMLVAEGVISEGELQAALARQKQEGGFLGHNLVALEVISEKTLISFLVKQCKIPHLSLLDYQIGRDILALVPEPICRQHQILPIDRLGTILTVAMVDPLNVNALEEVRRVCPDLRIKPILCAWRDYMAVCKRVFGEQVHASKDARQAAAGGKPVYNGPVPAPARLKLTQAQTAQTAASQDETHIIRPPREMAPASPETRVPESPPAGAVAATKAEGRRQEDQFIGRNELTAALQDALREVLAGLSNETARQAQPPIPVPSGQEIARAVRDGLRGALGEIAEMLRGLSQQVSTLASVAQQLEAVFRAESDAAATSAEHMAAVVRDGLREATTSFIERSKRADNAYVERLCAELAAVQETFRDGAASLIEELRNTAPAHPAGAALPSAEQLAAAVHDSVQDAVKQSVDSVLRTTAQALLEKDEA